jgi:hypothetical protein
MSHIPTQKLKDEVMKLAAIGVTNERIAKILKITPKALKEHYSWELENGGAEATKSVADALFRNAMGGSVQAQIFWLKSQAGWKDVNTTEIIGSDEHPGIKVQIVPVKSDKKKGSDNGGSEDEAS